MQRSGTVRVGLTALVVVSLTSQIACQNSARRTLTGSPSSTSAEPGLTAQVEPGVSVVEPGGGSSSGSSATTRTVSVVDRHPLLRKPKEYYDNTNSNKVVKTAAAAVVGVPAGIVGEIKQIVVGAPSPETNTAPSSTVY